MGRTRARLLLCFTACLAAQSVLTAADAGKELLDAAAQGHTARVQDLVAKGASLETRDKNGRTPLMLAAQHGHAATVGFLLGKGANAAARDQTGATAWVLAMFAPAGNRSGNAEVLQSLPQPPRPRIAVEALWTTSNIYNSCVMRLDELTRFLSSLQPDLLALRAFRRYAADSGKDLVEITGANARGVEGPDNQAFVDNDAVIVLTVRPGVACLPQQSADQVSLTLEVQLLRARDRAVLLRKSIGGGALKSLSARIVTGQAQYLPVYLEWIQPYAEQAWRAAVEAWFRAE
jgi:hypothetical protein